MLPYAGDLDGKKIHVQAPSAVLFLCGGQYSNISAPIPLSLRDAFLKISDNPATRGKLIVQAEDIKFADVFAEHYNDFLQFETDLAQITELILLFCESEGSFTELGAFAMVEEIASRLLVVVRDKYWSSDSFIKHGPLRQLENHYGEKSVYVLDDIDIGMRGNSAADVKIDVLRDRLQDPIVKRLRNREATTFDLNRPGHIIKLIVGLIQEYGALTIDEILDLITIFGVSPKKSTVSGYLLCAETVNWIVKKRKGYTTFYIAANLPDAATLIFKEDAQIRVKTRRRILIREHWTKTDQNRHRAIQEVFGGTSK